jgi:small subunit ribosomal protein S6
MNKYELMVMYKADLKETEVKKNISLLKEYLEKKKGKIVKDDFLGIKDLSYEMEKQTQAYYYVCVFEIDGSEIFEVASFLKRNEEAVLRHLISKV